MIQVAVERTMDEAVVESVAARFAPAKSEPVKTCEREKVVRVLRPGLTGDRLLRELLRARDESDVGQRALAFHLHETAVSKAYQQWGCSSAEHFAEVKLDMSRRKARDLIRCGRMLGELPLLDAGFAAGRIVWTRVRLLLRVVEADTEKGWLELAEKLSFRDLEARVLAARKGDAADKTEGKGLPEVTFRFAAKVRVLTQALLDKSREKAAALLGEEVSDDVLLSTVCGAFLEQKVDGQDRERHSSFQVVARHDVASGRMEVETSEGSYGLSDAEAEMIACDAAVVKACGCEADRQAGSGPTPEALRNRVLARDGYRCLSCSSTTNLHVHHVRFRSQGGLTVASNLATICMTCHALIHEGLLQVTGPAPHELTFRDRRGEEVGSRAPGSVIIVRDPEAGPMGPDPSKGPPHVEEVTLAAVPQTVSQPWWQAHRHLFTWNEARGAMQFEPGLAREAPATSPSCAGAGGPCLGDLVGQTRVIGSLTTAILAAQKQERELPHVLLTGPAGCGKTTLARAVAHEMGVRACVTSGPALEKPSMMFGLLAGLAKHDILFVDEIHALPTRAAEMLYEGLEGGSLSIPVFDGSDTRTLTLKLSPFTCIGATTEPDRLPKPLRSRFPMIETVELYEEVDLGTIIQRWLEAQGLHATADAIAVLAAASLGTARNAKSLAARARDVTLARSCQDVGGEEARLALGEAGLDERGLGPDHRMALAVLDEQRRPLGVGRLAGLLGITRRAFAQLLEPDLLRLGLVIPTARGLALA